MLMNYHAKKKGFATLFSFPFPKALFPHSHIKVFLHKGAYQKLSTDQCQGMINILKGMCAGFHEL